MLCDFRETDILKHPARNSKRLNVPFIAFQTFWAPYAITSLSISNVQGIECTAHEVFQLHFVHRRSNITL